MKYIVPAIAAAAFAAVLLPFYEIVRPTLLRSMGGVASEEITESALKHSYFHRGLFTIDRAECMEKLLLVIAPVRDAMEPDATLKTFENEMVFVRFNTGSLSQISIQLHCVDSRVPGLHLVFGSISSLTGDTKFFWSQLRKKVDDAFADVLVTGDVL